MGSSDDESDRPSRSRRRRPAALLVAGLLCSPLFIGIAVFVGPVVTGGAVALLIGALIAVSWRRSGAVDARTDSETETEETDADVWNAIPSRQYEGRHVEAGGLARGEQERALQDIQQRADELTDDPSQE